MINENLFPVALTVLNIPAFAIFCLTLIKLRHNKIRSFFILTLICGILWINALLYFWSVHVTAALAPVALKVIFISGVLLLPAFAEFVSALSGRAKRDPVLYGFYASGLATLVLILSDLVVSGFEWRADGAGIERVLYAPFRLYFVGHFLLFGAYIFYRLWRLARNSADEVIGFQLREVFTAGGITFVLISLTNALLPVFVNRSVAVLLGPVFPIIFLMRIYALLVKGDRYFLTRQFEVLVSQYGKNRFAKNMIAWRELLAFVSRVFESDGAHMNRRLSFSNASGSLDLMLSKTTTIAIEQKSPAEQFAPLSAGMADQTIHLDRDNKRMFFALLRAETLLKEKLIPELENRFEAKAIPAGEIMTMERIAEILDTNAHEMAAMTGVDFYCFSEKFAEAVSETMNLARTGEPMLFLGDRGTGRSLLARVANQAAGKFPVAELFPEHEETFPAEAMKLLATDGDLAVIVHNLSVLKPEQIQLIEKLYLNRRGKIALYITAAREFYGAGLDLPENLRRAMHCTVTVPPLSEREADVFHLALAFIREHRNVYPEIPFRAVEAGYVQSALRKAQHHQVSDIRQHALRLCLAASPPVLTASQLAENTGATKLIPAETLSALEESERSVIRTYLIKNKLNKRRTAMELDITINTLVAKISRYKLSYLFER